MNFLGGLKINLKVGKLLFQGSILIAIIITFLFFNVWGIGSLLSGLGIFFVGTFMAYLVSNGEDLNEKSKQSYPIKEYSTPWIKQWNNNCKDTMVSWLQESPSDFVSKVLLTFVPLSSQTLEYFMELLAQESKVSKREYIKAEREISRSSDVVTDGYLAELLLAQIIYFHIIIFINDQTALLKRNHLTIDSFLDQFHQPMPMSRASMKKYEEELKNSPLSMYQQNVEYYMDFLNFLELKPIEEILVLVDMAFKETYNNNINFIIDELEKNESLAN